MHAWERRGMLACILWPISMVFRGLAGLRRGLYLTGILNTYRVSVPVVVAGNIFVGGTGKTPLTIWLVDALRKAGYVPGVISRGYRAHQGAPRLVRKNSAPHEVGDEPLLIAARAQCPVMVGRDRVAAARALLEAHPEINVIISDDGLQHYALARSVEIVLFDARGVGNGWMLPAGPLREPVTRRRDFTVVNGLQGRLQASLGMPDNIVHMRLIGAVAERLSDRTQRATLVAINQEAKRIVAAAGIGNPARFFAMLRDAGLHFDAISLPDHYDYAINPFADLQADIILITEKDAVKCTRIADLENDPRLWVVPVTAHIDAALVEQIVEKLRGCTTA